MSDYLTLYPGVYLPEEEAALKKIKEQIQEGLSRRNYSFEELVASSGERCRGLSYKITAMPEEVQAKMMTLDPENPRWFEGELLPVPETWSCPKGGYFGGMSREFGDETCVKEHHHCCRFLKKVYQGDTLYPVLMDQQVWDATPYEGSQFRTWALQGTGYVYNQHGELVLIQTCGVKECFRIYADPAKRTWNAENIGVTEPEFSTHPIHHYTQEDWETIQELRKQELRRGNIPLYFEDVSVGDMAPITVDGPYTCPGRGGMIMSVNAPSRSDWYVRTHFGDPILTVDEYGIYHHSLLDKQEAEEKQKAMEEMMRNHPHPKEPPKGKKEEPHPLKKSPVEIRGRATMENYTGRDAALRCIHNWMGAHGTLTALSWCIGAHPHLDRGIPRHPNRKSPFADIPGMEHRYASIHGEEGDLSITRLYITGKHQENGLNLVDITWWCETIEGQIHTEGTATVALPSRT